MTAQITDYLTVTQAAAQLGVSPQRVRQLIAGLDPPDRLDVHARLTLLSRVAVDRLRAARQAVGRPVGWRKKKPSR